MRGCYHKNCDTLSHVTFEALGFLSKSCDTVVMTTDLLTKVRCWNGRDSPNDEGIVLADMSQIVVQFFLQLKVERFLFQIAFHSIVPFLERFLLWGGGWGGKVLISMNSRAPRLGRDVLEFQITCHFQEFNFVV